jgi:hypothetical protein
VKALTDELGGAELVDYGCLSNRSITSMVVRSAIRHQANHKAMDRAAPIGSRSDWHGLDRRASGDLKVTRMIFAAMAAAPLAWR